MSTHNDDISEPTPPEIWNNILKHKVEKDDPLWKEYIKEANVFDERMVNEWNKVVDVTLVYVALLISILTTFITRTSIQFQRNPADITNDLLVAIYNQLAVESNSTSIPPVDPRSYFNQPKADYDAAVIHNALLYTSLSLCTIVSVIALAAKLWLVSYSHEVFSVGSPYDRAMKRQEAYNGILVWNLGAVINILPLVLIIALYLFGFFVFASIWPIQHSIGYAVATVLTLGLMILGLTSLGAAFVPGCPFRSSLSTVIQIPFKILQTLSKRIRCGRLSPNKLRWLRIGSLAFLWVALAAVIAYATLFRSSALFSLIFFLVVIITAYSAQQEVVHKPQKYKISHLAGWMFLTLAVIMAVAAYFRSQYPIFVTLYIAEMSVIVFTGWMVGQMSKSMAETGEIDAIAWLLKSTPSQDVTFFKKAGQMASLVSNGGHYRPRLLESLMPLLTLLITSHHVPEHPSTDTHSPSSKVRRNFRIALEKRQSNDLLNDRYALPIIMEDDPMVSIDEDPRLENLEIYVSCLARLTEFMDYEGSFWCMREDAMRHPQPEKSLIDKLVVLANPRHRFQAGLKSAATKVLNNYKLDIEGNPLRSAATLISNNSGLDSQGQPLPRSHEPGDPATHIEPAHSSIEVELVPIRHKSGESEMC